MQIGRLHAATKRKKNAKITLRYNLRDVSKQISHHLASNLCAKMTNQIKTKLIEHWTKDQ